MTDKQLSPAAQAVLHSFWNAPVSPTRNCQIAAAIRALAYNVYSDEVVTCGGSSYALVIERDDILAIADELEGVGDGQTIQNLSTQEQISEEENERRFKKYVEMLNNLKPGEIREMMGPEFMEEFRRVSQ
jgi:hypothetical protein